MAESNKAKLLINGYVRNVQSLLPKKRIIPLEVIEICRLFWSDSSPILIYTKCSFGIIHRNLQTMSKITSKKYGDLNYLSPPFCYIKNISSGNQKKIDGIISTEGEHLAIILFESNNIDNDLIEYKKIESKRNCTFNAKASHSFIFCGPKHGIISEFGGDLYQMRLKQDIYINNNDFNFNKIAINNTCFRAYFRSNYNHNLLSSYLSMSYLKSTEKLFAITINARGTHSKCGIFDFHELNWTEITNIPYNTNNNGNDHRYFTDYTVYEQCENLFDENIIFAVSNRGHTAKYHFKLDRWEILIDDAFRLKEKTKHIVWMENNHILCCSDGQYFGYLDIRDDKGIWTEMNDIKNILDKSYNSYVFN